MSTPTSTSEVPKPNPKDRIGTLISARYRITGLLGEGGMGAVYVAEHTHMRKRFALKLLHAELAENEEALARFRREAEAAAHVEHPNVVAATDFGQTEDGHFFLVLEYIDGTSLRSVLEAGNPERPTPLTPRRALWIARQMALALERAHDAGVVHRDLKPENVMLVQKEDVADFVKVLDFGVARFDAQGEREAGSQPLTRIGTIMGTPEYMAPEQALGERVGPPSDLYAVGIILYEMLTGKHPFDGDQMAMLSLHIVGPIPEMATRAPGVLVPPAVEAVVRRLLEKDAKARHPNARALVDAIDAAALASGIDLPIGAPSSSRGLARSPRPSDAALGDGRASLVVVPTGDHATSALADTSLGLPAAKPPMTSALAPLLSHFGKVRTAVEPIAKDLLVRAADRLAALSQATKVPRLVLLAGIVGVPFFFFVLILALVVRGASSTVTSADGGVATADSAVVTAPPDKVRAAAAKGPAALEALADKYPGDIAVLRELAFAYDTAGRTSDALGTIRRIVDTAPDALPRELVRVVVHATSRFETADDAFALLEGPLGADGATALYELAESKDAPDAARARAQRSLAKPGVRANAPPGIAFLFELSAASTCDGKKDVLTRSGEAADERALPSLRALKRTTGCGRRERYDCWRCLRGDDNALDRALRAAESHGTR